MYKTLIKSAVAGGVIVFIWGMFSWMVLPWHTMCMKNFQDETCVGQTIAQNAPQSGIYTIPGMGGQKAMDQQMMMQQKNHKKDKNMMMHPKPFVFCAVMLGGMNMGVGNFIWALVFVLVAAYLISWMVMQTKGLSYMGQVGFVVLVALVAGIIAKLPAWNWMGFPLGYVVICMIDMLIAWFLAGLAMVKLCHHKKR